MAHSRHRIVAGALWIAGALLFFTPGSTLQAEMLHVYDLDSLMHLSTAVVEADVVRSYQAHGHDLIDVKVATSHKGDFKQGQTVVVAHTDVYRKPKEILNSEPLAAGDRLVLFFVRAKSTDFFRIPDDAVIHMPLPGGMRLIQGDHVFGFSQQMNPGPYVADVPADPAKAKVETIEQFRGKLRDSLRQTAEWARLVEAKQDQLDTARLLKVLAERKVEAYGGRDWFSERICIRFAESHDPALLSRALAVADSYYGISILQRGFGTPQGRDYLLDKVTDAKEPMPARLRHANALANAGTAYRVTFTDITANSWRHVGEADEGNSGYMTRIAKAARASAKDAELCERLVRGLDNFGQGIVQNKPESLMMDLRGALAVLKELYATQPSEELQFAIEKATAYDPDSYEKLNSSCGSFISILTPADPDKYTKPEKRSLIFEYSYTTVLMNREAEVQPSVVLVHRETQKRHVLPTQLRIRGWSTGGGSHSVVLPEDLPPGKYRVFLQLRDGDKVTSTGHSFDADL